jgi:transcriptional regulator with GAF, ATPase, and Fis domain
MTTGGGLKKTAKMLAVEKRIRRPLERALPEMVNENGLTGAAKRLGVSKATLSYWMLKLGIQMRHVALAPGEIIEVKRTSD